MDEQVSCFLSELIVEEEYSQCLQSVDLFSGEHTDSTMLTNYLNQQVKHTIGPKVTSKVQVTDVRFAKLGKSK